MIHHTLFLKLIVAVTLTLMISACSQSNEEQASTTQQNNGSPKGSATKPSNIELVYSKFGVYQALPEWSDWCGAATNPKTCADSLQNAVFKNDPTSRPIVRAHGWKLWAAITAPLKNSGYDPATGTSDKFGTTGCWFRSQTESPACSGVFSLWLSWPNTGVPYNSATEKNHRAIGHLIATNRNFSASDSSVKTGLKAPLIAGTPDPTKVQTVNTTDSVPTYPLPWLTVAKQCKIPDDDAKQLVANANAGIDQAWTKLSDACTNNGVKGVICPDQKAVCDGNAFVNQGDIMIATESLSVQAWNSIQNNKLYGHSDTLTKLYNMGDQEIAATQVTKWLDNNYISTKHMFWPVKGCRPGAIVGQEGCRIRYGALPPWVPANFKNDSYASNTNYRGYETWGKVVAIDTCGDACPPVDKAQLKLEGVQGAKAISTTNPDIYGVKTFIHLQISEETLNTGFTAADRALLDQATVWAYGSESKGFEAGDFLVVAAMHVTTKEINSWTFQSVWWSPMNDTLNDCPLTEYNHCFGQTPAYGASSVYSGLDAAAISTLDQQVGTTWRDNYVMSDSYGIKYEIDGTATDVKNYFDGTPPDWATQRPTGKKVGLLPVAMNVYIEPVIHPLGTNCQNCHRRAGSISNFPGNGEYTGGVGRANYQNSQCPSLLADYDMPANDPCMTTPWAWNDSPSWNAPAQNQCSEKANGGTKCNGKEAYPIVNTDLSWIISDGHLQKGQN